MQMSNDDGNVLVENIFIGSELTWNPIDDIGDWPGITSSNELKNPYSKRLFEMSSPLPESYRQMLLDEGYSLNPGAKMLIPGANKELIELAFAVSGATQIG